MAALNVNDEGVLGAEPQVSIRKRLLKLLRRWPKILAFFILSVVVGFTVNRYSTPIYEVKARITSKKFSGKQNSPVPGMIDASFFTSGLVELYEEIPILKSPRRIAATLDRVDFSVSYFSEGYIKTVESEKGYGFQVRIDSVVDDNYPYGIPLFVNHISDKIFELKSQDDIWQKLVEGQQFQFGKSFQLGSVTLTIINTNGRTAEKDKHYFVMNRKADLVQKYIQRLNINWVTKGSAMLDLHIFTELPERDLKFMEAYYEVIEEIGLLEKNEILDNTIRFIDTQMAVVNDSLNYYQGLANDIRLDYRKLPTNTEGVFTRLNELDNNRAAVLLSERYFDYLINYFKSNRDAEVFAPSLLGLNIPLLEGWVSQYINQKLTEEKKLKQTLLTEANARNPLLALQDTATIIDGRLEKAIYEAIRSARQVNADKLREIDQQFSYVYSSIDDIQSGSRELTQHQRLFQINSSLFDLFISRKAEASISKASATSDYRIINNPGYSRNPVEPDKKINLAIAAALGLMLPVLFFFALDVTNNYILDKEDLQANLHIPLLGNVPHSNYESNLVVKEHPRSVVAESFRAIRSNLRFLSANVKTRSHTFIVTSTIGGEGKTFCSINLAQTLALSNKKTIIIGADLRKPELGNYLGKPVGNGLSNYLAGYVSIEEVIDRVGPGGPEVIIPGDIPPNPSELLGNERMSLLIQYLKEHYDYIIIDTPPIGLVSDAMDLFKFTDYNILVVRQGVTPKTALRMIDELYQDGRLVNFATLFNDLEILKNGNSYYGSYMHGMGYSGYGYGYYEEDNGKKGKKKKT